MQIEIAETCSLSNNSDGNIQVDTGGEEKYRFSVQLNCLNSVRKSQPVIIIKGAPMASNSRIKPFARQLQNHVSNNWLNAFPTEDKVFFKCYITTNSSGDIPIDILGKALFPEIGIPYGRRGGGIKG